MGPPRKPFNKKSDDKLKTFQKSSKKPFKPSQKSNNAIPMHLEDDVPDFPRGTYKDSTSSINVYYNTYLRF